MALYLHLCEWLPQLNAINIPVSSTDISLIGELLQKERRQDVVRFR